MTSNDSQQTFSKPHRDQDSTYSMSSLTSNGNTIRKREFRGPSLARRKDHHHKMHGYCSMVLQTGGDLKEDLCFLNESECGPTRASQKDHLKLGNDF